MLTAASLSFEVRTKLIIVLLLTAVHKLFIVTMSS